MTARGPAHTGGVHPETAALKNVLAQAGVTDPHTSKPFTEAMLLGLGGGLGFSYYVFQYKGFPPSFFVSGRHLLQDNVAFLEGICERLGIKTRIKETSGATTAAKALRAELEAGPPVIAWVDLASLPYSGLPETLRRQIYHVVVVHGVDDGKDEAYVGDLPKQPITVKRDELLQARAAIGSHKNRILAVEPPKALEDLAGAVREGIRVFTREANAGRGWNNRIEGIRKWGDLLTSQTKEGWPKIFVPGISLYMGMGRAYTFIELYGTGGGLLRGLYADFLEEARDVLGKPALADVAERYRALQKQWSKLARSFLPDSAKPLAETRELLQKYERLFHAKGGPSVPEFHKIIDRLRAIQASLSRDFPLSEAQVQGLLAELQQQLYAIAEGEAAALEALRKAVP